jgi:hypothetical protein
MNKCKCLPKPIDLQKTNWFMAKDINKLFEDIDAYKKQYNVSSNIEFAKKVNEWLPINFLPERRNTWTNWKTGQQQMGDATYNCIAIFLKINLPAKNE